MLLFWGYGIERSRSGQRMWNAERWGTWKKGIPDLVRAYGQVRIWKFDHICDFSNSARLPVDWGSKNSDVRKLPKLHGLSFWEMIIPFQSKTGVVSLPSLEKSILLFLLKRRIVLVATKLLRFFLTDLYWKSHYLMQTNPIFNFSGSGSIFFSFGQLYCRLPRWMSTRTFGSLMDPAALSGQTKKTQKMNYRWVTNEICSLLVTLMECVITWGAFEACVPDALRGNRVIIQEKKNRGGWGNPDQEPQSLLHLTGLERGDNTDERKEFSHMG